MGLSKKEIIQAVWSKIKGILGTNDISEIGDGTVTGAISSINSNLENAEKEIESKFSNKITALDPETNLNSLSYASSAIYYVENPVNSPNNKGRYYILNMRQDTQNGWQLMVDLNINNQVSSRVQKNGVWGAYIML